jgi:VWFA-related protein
MRKATFWMAWGVALLGFAGRCLSQVPAAQQGTQQGAPPGPPVSTFTAVSREVQLDVVVVDAKGHPVTGLTKDDFVLTENGEVQPLRDFEEHGPMSAAEQAALNPMATLPPNTFTNFTSVTDTNALTVILMDALDCGLPAQMYLHEQLIEYLKTAKPGTPMALFLLNSRMRLIQGFTTDPQVLMEAVKSKRSGLSVPFYPANGSEVSWQFRRDIRTEGMQVLGRYLAGFPGRKNLIWFTGYEPHKIIFNNASSNAFPDFAVPDFNMDEYTEALRLSRVAVYPVDAGGLRTDPMYSAERRGPPNVSVTGDSFQMGLDAEQQHFDEVAERTGGKAYVNNNGLKQIIGEVVDAGSHYYSVSYAPTNRDWHGQYRHIDVELVPSVRQRGLQLQYRHGYYARNRLKRDQNNLAKAKNATSTGVFVPADEGQPVNGQGVLLQRAKLESLQQSMTLGAIPPTELVFNASIAPVSTVEQKAKSDALPPNNYLRPAYRNKPYREMELLYALDTRTLRLTQSQDGVRHGEVEFVVVVYSDTGDVVNSLLTTAMLDLSEATYQKMLQQGFTMKQTIAVPVKGSYSLRLGVHDVVGERVGGMEIPMQDVKPGVAGVGLAMKQ